MKVQYFDLKNPQVFDEDITACIGYFDGLHLGHQKLIAEVLRAAAQDGSIPTLITFEPDPWTLIKNLNDIPHITPMQERIEIGETLGIRNWIILKFEKEMQSLSLDEFHTRVLQPLQIKTLVCGYDFHYGFRGRGSVESLKLQRHFQVKVVDEVSSEHKKISSSRIEELIECGDVEKAYLFLGRYYTMRGFVKKGAQVGRVYGFATANLQRKENYVIPMNGVYVGAVKVDGTWHGAMINVGHNPTHNYQNHISIEAHIVAFDEDLYGKNVIFKFCMFLRDECKFDNVEELVKQLKLDRQKTIAYVDKRKAVILCD